MTPRCPYLAEVQAADEANQRATVIADMKAAVQAMAANDLLDSSGNVNMELMEQFLLAGQRYTAQQSGSRPASKASLQALAVAVSIYSHDMLGQTGSVAMQNLKTAVVAVMRTQESLRTVKPAIVRRTLLRYWTELAAMLSSVTD